LSSCLSCTGGGPAKCREYSMGRNEKQ
jgi:hypothetical protein